MALLQDVGRLGMDPGSRLSQPSYTGVCPGVQVMGQSLLAANSSYSGSPEWKVQPKLCKLPAYCMSSDIPLANIVTELD